MVNYANGKIYKIISDNDDRIYIGSTCEGLSRRMTHHRAESKKYQSNKGTCPYCDILQDEEKSPRLVYADEQLVAFCPYASEFHHAVWILPRRHVDNIADLTSEETKSFAQALKKVVVKLFTINIEFNFFLHKIVHDQDQHFYLKIQPRESVWAGLELGAGIVVNSLSPEKAAEFYRS